MGFTAADAATITLSTTRPCAALFRTYPTTATTTGAALSNYTVTYVPGAFTITKAAATVTAHDETKTYGAADPALTATAMGFTTADAAIITVNATRASEEAVGTYPTTA